MATFTITVRDEDLKTEIGEAFAAQYNNPNSLTNEELVVHHVSNFIREKLNVYRKSQAIDTAIAAVTEEDSLE